MSLDHRLSRWKRPCDKCVPWEHSVTRAMDNVTTHFAVGIAMSLAADVFWHISAQSSDHLLWDPRLYMAEDSAEGEQVPAVQAHLGVDRANTGAVTAMDRSGDFDSCCPDLLPDSGSLSRGLFSIDAHGPEQDGVYSSAESMCSVQKASSLSSLSCSSACRRRPLSAQARATRRVRFCTQVEFWFPAEHQFSCNRGRCLGTTCASQSPVNIPLDMKGHLIADAAGPRAAPATAQVGRNTVGLACPAAFATAVSDPLFTVFDKLSGPSVLPKPRDWDDELCKNIGLDRTFVPNPTARVVAAPVPGWPVPQIIISAASVLDTHRSVALTFSTSTAEVHVVEARRWDFLHSLLTDVAPQAVARTTHCMCTVNGVHTALTAVLPGSADTIVLHAGYELPCNAARIPQCGGRFALSHPMLPWEEPSETDRNSFQQAGDSPAIVAPTAGEAHLASALADSGSTPEAATASIGVAHRKDWFTSFGSVEGHQVMRKRPDWSDAQCIRHAVSHAAPAIARPTGRCIARPLPGLFTPQVILTRQLSHSAFRTIVIDLRPIGADIRVEDLRLQQEVQTAFLGEGMLAPLFRRLGEDVSDLHFLVDQQPAERDSLLHNLVDTITVLRQRPGGLTQPASGSGDANPRFHSPAPCDGARWGRNPDHDRLAYRPLQPPVPPLPSEAQGDVVVLDAAFRQGLSFTVFDVFHNMRILPRKPGLHPLELVEIAVSLTPQIRHPVGYRIQEHIWDDLPTPQVVIWGALETGFRVIPIRDLDAPSAFCTVAVPADACPIQILYLAEKCPAFTGTRVQVARRERFYFTDRHSAPAFEAHAAQGAHIGELRSIEAPSLPAQRQPGRWQSRFPACLRILRPRDTENLWPVTEVVIHSQHATPLRMPLAFDQDELSLLVQSRQALGLSTESVWRLPTHCPAEVGCPLHLFLYEPIPWDPWNDPAEEASTAWGLCDVRRVVRPPHPGYVMLQLPALLDFPWIRQTLAASFPEFAPVAAAYMGDEAITAARSPWGLTPLITVFPRSRFSTCVPGMTDAIIDVHSLLHLRAGWSHQSARPPMYRRHEETLPQPDIASGAVSQPQRTAPSRSHIIRRILEPAWDEDLADYIRDGQASEDVIVWRPGHSPQTVQVPRHLPPDRFNAVAADCVGLADRCTMHVPTLAPLVAGHIPSVVMLPSQPTCDRYLLIDARLVTDGRAPPFWVQEAPGVLSPVITLALLRRSQPDLLEIGEIFVDGTTLRGYAELSARVTLMTLLPAHWDLTRMPTPLVNCHTLRQRSGFVQIDCRLRDCSRLSTATTTQSWLHATTDSDLTFTARATTTSTTAMQTGQHREAIARSAPAAMTIDGKLIRFHLADSTGHVEVAALRGSAPVEDVMAQLCFQLNDHGGLHPGLRFHACERIISDTDWEFSAFLCAAGPGEAQTAWIDARPMGLPAFAIPLPFVLTDATLTNACGVEIPFDACIAVCGEPWTGRPRNLRCCDVVSIRANMHELFTLPLSAFAPRVPGIAALLVSHIGPGFPSPVRDYNGDLVPLGELLNGYTAASIHSHWALVHISCGLALCTEGDYQKCVLIAADIPPFQVSVGTRTSPEDGDVNWWYRTWLRPLFGQRLWRNAGLAFGDFTVLFDCNLDATFRRPWVVCIGEHLDVVIAGPQGEGLEAWPAPEGWSLRPVLTVGPIGQAALQHHDAAIRPIFSVPLPESRITCAEDTSDEDDAQIADPFRPLWTSSDEETDVILTAFHPPHAASQLVASPATNSDTSGPADGDILEIDTSDSDVVLLQTGACRRILEPTVHATEDTQPAADPVFLMDDSLRSVHDLQRTDARRCPLGETTPRTALLVFGRRVATPCRRGLEPERKREVLAEQSGAREAQTQLAAETRASVLAIPTQKLHTGHVSTPAAPQPISLWHLLQLADRPARKHVTTLKLMDLLPIHAGPTSCTMSCGATLDSLLQALEPFTLPAIAGRSLETGILPAAVRCWICEMPVWDQQGALDQVILYTDGSYNPTDGTAGWAVLCLGMRGDTVLHIASLADSMRVDSDSVVPAVPTLDAHVAEAAAMGHDCGHGHCCGRRWPVICGCWGLYFCT